MTEDLPTRRWPIWIALALAVAAVGRLLPLGWVALTDNTESRYASIAWQMFSSGDWVTPRIFTQGSLVPFLGKPPLTFWLTSLSYHVFGVSEWSSRVPSFLLAVAIVVATMGFARHVWGRRVAMLSGVILATAGFYFVLAGACVLDVPLAASVAGAMIAFARFAESENRRRWWGLAFFFALAVGMLAKGPIALVLVGLALGLWIAIVGRWRLVVQLPWLSGLIVFFAVAAPWYILAERATPGFLYYFLVHEHILRYVSHEYGDLYGAGRERPYGASWVFLFVSFLPWSVLCIVAMLRWFRGQRIWAALRSDPWLTYALVWGLAPAVFFTMARQILVTYLVPGFAGLALATAVGLDRWMASESSGGLSRWLKWHVAAIGLAAVAGGVSAVIDGAPIALALAVPLSTACVLWLARHVLRSGSPERLAGVLGLTTVTALTATLFLVATKINDQNSSQAVLAQLYRDPAARQRPLITPMASENSAFFYVQAVHGGRFVCAGREGTHVVRERLGRNGNELFLFERKEAVHLKPDLLARLQPVAETVYWIAYEEKPRQAPAQP